MKTNKASYTILTTATAIACLLAVGTCANAAQKKVKASDPGHKPRLGETARANHNSPLLAAFYESNHLIDG
jgi:hypothetical protein